MCVFEREKERERQKGEEKKMREAQVLVHSIVEPSLDNMTPLLSTHHRTRHADSAASGNTEQLHAYYDYAHTCCELMQHNATLYVCRVYLQLHMYTHTHINTVC